MIEYLIIQLMKNSKSLAFVASLIATVSTAPAAPAASKIVDLSEDLPFFYPNSDFELFEPSNAQGFTELSQEENVEVAKNTLLQKLNLAEQELRIKNVNTDSAGIVHVYAVHVVDGVEVQNHNAAAHVQNGEVVAQSASFTKDSSKLRKRGLPTNPSVSLSDAIAVAVKKYGLPRDSVPPSTVYIQTQDGHLALAHKFQLRDDSKFKWYEVLVDATTGEILSASNFYNSATYKVIKLPFTDAEDGFSLASDSENPNASPRGWHNTGSRSYSVTLGNNVDSQIDGYRTEGGSGLNFAPEWKSTQEPTVQSNRDAAIVNNFYLSNMVHDITYEYGFDEVSGNFQANNFGKGGAGNDYVVINNHASGKNNANFATPPDGQNPVMNMYLWDRTSPQRDGSLDNSVPIHEYGHGISNRLTGGASASSCLTKLESRGLGEGWSDALAFMLTMKPEDKNTKSFALGSYVVNKPQGIRSHPYSTSLDVNPLLCNFNLIQTAKYNTTTAHMILEQFGRLCFGKCIGIS
jgi:extracellular elastinolytic metalloproteinase